MSKRTPIEFGKILSKYGGQIYFGTSYVKVLGGKKAKCFLHLTANEVEKLKLLWRHTIFKAELEPGSYPSIMFLTVLVNSSPDLLESEFALLIDYKYYLVYRYILLVNAPGVLQCMYTMVYIAVDL